MEYKITKEALQNDLLYDTLEALNNVILCTDGFYKMVEISQIIDKSLPVNGEYEDDASLIKIVL